MECDNDLILKYQALLESEKRRLAVVNLNSSEEYDTDKEGITESQNTEWNKQKKITSFITENDSNKISTVVSNKQEISTNPSTEIPKKIKCETNAKARAAAMDQWVTDSFYTSFPSFKKQDLATNSLADDRREDYKKYLAEVSNKKLLDVTRSRKRANLSDSETDLSKQIGKQTSARIKMLDDLKHSDLAYNFHNPDAIQERNQKIAIERTRRKIELQQELVRQIEEKKLEIEKIRAKEKEEDELLQRRLENQIKSLQLAEELHKQNTAKMVIANPINKTNNEKDVVPKLEKEAHTYKSIDHTSGRCLSENGTKNVTTNNDRQLYKFFSNSAPHNESNVNYYNHHHPVGFDNMYEPEVRRVSTTIHHSTQQCHHCRHPVPVLCGSCCQNNFNRPYEYCDRCNLLQDMDVCNSCRRPWVRAWHHNRGGPIFDHLNTCTRNNRPQILEITYQDHSSQYNYKDDVVQSTNNCGPSDKRDMNTKSLSNNDSTMNLGVETHLEKKSPSKDDEILELKRKNDILIAKHARNYGSLRKRKSIPYEFETNRQTLDDSFPLPLMREPLPTTVSTNTDNYKSRQNSQAHKKLEYKWEIPVVQRQVITNNPSKVLTQVGAIAKQLQLEKLNFGNVDM